MHGRGESCCDYMKAATNFFTMATHPTEYAHPETLVETDWLEKHLKDDGIRIIESNEDILLYDTGHIPGAVHIDWRADLQDPVIRDYISPEKFARLCSHFLRRQGELGGVLRALGVPVVWS